MCIRMAGEFSRAGARSSLLNTRGGRSIPAAFDRATGKFLYFNIAESGKGTGGSLVMASEKEFFVHTRARGTRAHDLATGKKSLFTVNEPVLDGTCVYCAANYSTNFTARMEAEQKLEAARYGETRAKGDMADARALGDEIAIQKATAACNSATNPRRAAGSPAMVPLIPSPATISVPSKPDDAARTRKTAAKSCGVSTRRN